MPDAFFICLFFVKSTIVLLAVCVTVGSNGVLPLYFYPGCTCFLLLVCNRTTVCGTTGDVATYNFAAKNFR